MPRLTKEQLKKIKSKVSLRKKKTPTTSGTLAEGLGKRGTTFASRTLGKGFKSLSTTAKKKFLTTLSKTGSAAKAAAVSKAGAVSTTMLASAAAPLALGVAGSLAASKIVKTSRKTKKAQDRLSKQSQTNQDVILKKLSKKRKEKRKAFLAKKK